jgi:hypothetical protein
LLEASSHKGHPYFKCPFRKGILTVSQYGDSSYRGIPRCKPPFVKELLTASLYLKGNPYYALI